MRVTLKLYASLGIHLPAHKRGNQAELEVAEGTSSAQLLEQHGVPVSQIHLVLVNGVFIPPAERGRALAAGDELAVWPPVAGG